MTNKEILVGLFTFLLAFTTFTPMVYAQEAGGFEYDLADVPAYWIIESKAFEGYGDRHWSDWKEVLSMGDLDGDGDHEAIFDTPVNITMGRLVLTRKDSFSGPDIWSVVVGLRAYLWSSFGEPLAVLSICLYDVTEGKEVVLKEYKASSGSPGWIEDESRNAVKPNHEYKLRLVLNDEWEAQTIKVAVEHVSITPSTEKIAEEGGIPWPIVVPLIAVITTAATFIVWAYRRRR